MPKRNLLNSLVLGAGLAGAVSAQEPAPASEKGANVTLNACVVDGKDGSYVLTHVVETSTTSATASDPTLKGMSGAQAASSADAIYWLSSDSTKLIKEHVGHKVEVTGVVTKETAGTVRVKQEPGKPGRDNKVEIQARGKEISAKTDEPVKAGAAGAVKSDEKQTLPVRRVKVATVKMLAPTCQ